MKRVIFLCLSVALLSSCVHENDAEIIESVVVEQVNVLPESDKNCEKQTCDPEDIYRYKIKLQTSDGTAYYYTNYKHEVGDTLMASEIFIQHEVAERSELKEEIKRLQRTNDSLTESNITMQFQYDLMLMFFENKIIPEEIEKSKKNLEDTGE